MLFWHGSCPYHAKMKKIMKRIGILIGWLVWTAGVSAQSWTVGLDGEFGCCKLASNSKTRNLAFFFTAGYKF
jgi:hypothetical protein